MPIKMKPPRALAVQPQQLCLKEGKELHTSSRRFSLDVSGCVKAFPLSPCSNLSNNKISEIEDGAFEGASSAVELHLTANHLESVRGSMFKGMEGLRML